MGRAATHRRTRFGRLRRGASYGPANAPSGTTPSGFMGTWTASGILWIGYPSRSSCEGRTLLQSLKMMQYFFFFHEYGRRVGMVPRSSLKGGKNSQMVEKRTRKPNTTQNQRTPQPRAHRPCLHHHVVFPLCKVKHVRRKRVSKRGLN